MVKSKHYDPGDIVTNRCPKDCPFRDRLDTSTYFCSFAIYADLLTPERRTRTEILQDGKINYHLPPHCDIYPRYKDKTDEILKMKHKYDQYGLKRYSKYEDTKLFVSGWRHKVCSKHKQDKFSLRQDPFNQE